MRTMRGSSVILLVVGLLHLCYATSSPSFKWNDCGVQLNKALHYTSASISPNSAQQDKALSINVQATVADTVYNAQTRLMVWKDGEVFMDVWIGDLCTILSNTKGLSCPLYVGQVSFTYEFDNVPTLPSGNYVVDIRSYVGSAGDTDGVEIGCIELVGAVTGASGSDCHYTSSFQVKLKGTTAVYTKGSSAANQIGDWIQIGSIGNLPNQNGNGAFVGDYMGTADVGGQISTSPYTWALNGTLISRDNSSQTIKDLYRGTFYVLYNNVINMVGLFNWTFATNPTSGEETLSGYMDLSPEYYVLSQFTWPTTIGNLAPFSVQTQADGTFTVQGSQQYCTCPVDACGVCNGNGKTCDFGKGNKNGNDWHARKKAAVAMGVVGLLLVVLIAELSRRIHKERRRRPIDDNDLVDHPEKPDYGTMAIDDAIREGERVV